MIMNNKTRSSRMLLWNLCVMSALFLLFIHSNDFGSWSVEGFLYSSPARKARQYPQYSARYRLELGEKIDPSQDPEESEGFFSRWLPGGKKKEKQVVAEAQTEGFIGRLFTRVKKAVKIKSDTPARPDETEKSGLPQTTNPLDSVGDRLKGMQSMLNNIRSDESSDSDKKIEQIRKASLERRKRQQLEDKKRKELELEQAKALKEAEKVASEKAMREYMVKREKLLKQKEQMERRRKIQAAAEAAKSQTIDAGGKPDAEESQKKSKKKKFLQGFMDVFEKKEEWIVVGPKTLMSPGAYVPVTAGGLDLLVVASADGKRLYCVANSCPHLGTPLETGLLQQREREPNRGKPISTSSDMSSSSALTEDCIVCPLHKTAFALASGEVRGEWCPYPPLIGPLTGKIKAETPLVTFDVRTRGKNIEVRISSSLEESSGLKSS